MIDKLNNIEKYTNSFNFWIYFFATNFAEAIDIQADISISELLEE